MGTGTVGGPEGCGVPPHTPDVSRVNDDSNPIFSVVPKETQESHPSYRDPSWSVVLGPCESTNIFPGVLLDSGDRLLVTPGLRRLWGSLEST